MAERSTQKFARTNDGLSEKNFPPVLKNKSATHNSEGFNDDELILVLSQSYENRRAAQAFEWESVRLGGTFRHKAVT
jgi:hypothetical protein